MNMSNVGQIIRGSDPLMTLIQEENFVGWVYNIDYDVAYVLTSDLWKARVLGIPHNCFLVASAMRPNEFELSTPEEREVILLRVVGSCKLPQDDDMIKTKIDHFLQQTGPNINQNIQGYDALTQNYVQLSGLECRVLGTFYNREGTLCLGSDLENFYNGLHLTVYRPRGDALRTIVNYVDPVQRNRIKEELAAMGITQTIEPFKIGTVRYTSTDRLHRSSAEELVPVYIQPGDFLARRTAVLGMTRTGKSNMIKQLVSVVHRVSRQSGVNIGQIIYDINGEYANANQQDRGALANIYPTETVRYRMLRTPGFNELQNNFYLQLNEGLSQIARVVRERGYDNQPDVNQLTLMSLDEPSPQEYSEHNRWQVRTAAYQALLFIAGFEAPPNHTVRFPANQEVREAVNKVLAERKLYVPDPNNGLNLQQAVQWFIAAREANSRQTLLSSSGGPWLDEATNALLNLIVQKNNHGQYIRGYQTIIDARPYHSPRRNREVGEEIYEHLVNGRIVILDLSVGDPLLRDKISKQIAEYIFNRSMHIFVEGNIPPNIVFYIEEAHNLIGKDNELTDTWPRLAKEGAKYRIALVYATQEVSSIHPNILANTENWFISHLNNAREINELARFYDFDDFKRSILRAQDVGFDRVKMLSSPFVVPVQIDRFDPSSFIDISTNSIQEG